MHLSGRCLCGAVRYTIEADPNVSMRLCHCLDCRKLTGSTNSTYLIVPATAFTLAQGKYKQFSKKADSGATTIDMFCGDCGSPLWREKESLEGMMLIRAGTLEDAEAVNAMKPSTELYTARRAGWLSVVRGAEQKSGRQ
ncbi:Mss4-like protein [Schizophyllum amplum]|uniref:Mss4-like protein n=1 Tax=Schizophyllum amplum TaxID=97359 RepID=A0A550CFD5_9AGAR|nr:Mss4-like protein [Auriculariopsis ampla]